MNCRKENLLNIRPVINCKDHLISDVESFQNKTLRPILKFQNELLIVIFKNYIKRYKNAFTDLSIDKKMDYIENALQKNTSFRNSLKGVVIGMFTVEEYANYSNNSSEINKRIMQLIAERLKDQLQLFDS